MAIGNLAAIGRQRPSLGSMYGQYSAGQGMPQAAQQGGGFFGGVGGGAPASSGGGSWASQHPGGNAFYYPLPEWGPPQGTPAGDIYGRMVGRAQTAGARGPTYQSAIEAGWLSPALWGNQPGYQTAAQLTALLSNPYGVNDASLRENLQGVNRAYDVARQKTGADVMGSGAAESGVGRSSMGNVETARAGGIADALRQWEQFRQTMGDERLRTLGLPWMQMYNQALQGGYSARYGSPQQQQGGGTDWGDLLKTGLAAYASYLCWVARAIYGDSDPRWMRARDWLLERAPESFRKFYMEHGPAVAEEVRSDPNLMKRWRSFFDGVLAGG